MHMLRRDDVPASSRNANLSSADLHAPTPPSGGWSAWHRTDEDDMGESYEHHAIIRLFLATLSELARERDWTRSVVASDQYFAWVEDHPLVRVSPDVYVLDDAPEPIPDSWQTWRPGHPPPRFALEVVSQRWGKDYDDNPPKYDQLGARELVIFDPDVAPGRTARTPLQVFRRDGDRLRRVAAGPGPLHSVELDAWLVVVPGPRLRLARDAAGADLVPTAEEQAAVLRRRLTDLTALRRENADLRRENADLRARLADHADLRDRVAVLEAALTSLLARV